MFWWLAQQQQPPGGAFEDPSVAYAIYGESWQIAWQLYQLQQLRNQTAQMQAEMLQQQAADTRRLAELEAGIQVSLDQAKSLASQAIIAAGNAVAQQQRELDAMRARAQSPSLTNIALGEGAGRGVSTPILQPPNIAGQLGGVPSLATLGSVPTVGGGAAPYTAWWTWSTSGPAPLGTGASGAMGSAAGNPAAGLSAFGGTAPASQPGANAPTYLPAVPPAPGS